MKAVSTIAALLATGAAAAPNTAARWARNEARLNARNADDIPVDLNIAWSGISMTTTDVKVVSAIVKAPVPGKDIPSASSAAWVGIDGNTCNLALLQTGFDITTDANADPVYVAWYEWYPSAAITFDTFKINPGDDIFMQVEVDLTTLRTGTATLENLSTGSQVNHTFDPFGTEFLCGHDADWIVEDYEEGFGQVPLDDFGTVIFNNATILKDGVEMGIFNATAFDINQNGVTFTDCGLVDNHTVTCTYI